MVCLVGFFFGKVKGGVECLKKRRMVFAHYKKLAKEAPKSRVSK